MLFGTAGLLISLILIQTNVVASFIPHHHYAYRRVSGRDSSIPKSYHRVKSNVQLFQSTRTVEKQVVILTEQTISGNVLPVASFDESDAFTSQAFLSKDNEYRRGLIVIGFITLLFSSNSPALHAAFSETSPPVLLLNAAVSCVALVGLVLGGPILEATTPLPSSLVEKEDTSQDELKAGLELGLWKFLGTTANLYGLSLTTASHGAFLIQLTTLIVPVVQGLMGVPIPRRIQFSIILALAGVFMFTQQVAEGGCDSMALGDFLCVVAAGFYSTYDLRLFQWGKLVKPRNLITNKIAIQAVLSILLLLAVGWEETRQFLLSADISGLLVVVVLWSGVAVNAIAPFLQVGGQQAIGPTRAQTLYASQPLWASILSYMFLGETVGFQGLIGGIAFLVALFLAATAEAPDPNCGKENCEV